MRMKTTRISAELVRVQIWDHDAERMDLRYQEMAIPIPIWQMIERNIADLSTPAPDIDPRFDD